MWECSSIGLSIRPGYNRPPYRGGPILIYNGKESEIHPFYPASKSVRAVDPNVSLLQDNGQLNHQVKNRSEKAAFLIFCLSSKKQTNDTNFKGQ